MADEPASVVGDYVGTLLQTLVREVRLELAEGREVLLGRITFARLDSTTLTLRIGTSGDAVVIALHPDWSGVRKLATTARRISPQHDTRAALELLQDEEDVDVH